MNTQPPHHAAAPMDLQRVRREALRWLVILTLNNARDGVDVAEYTVAVEPGIARPARYW